MGAGGDASGVPSTALVVPRDDTAYVEWLASELCSATQNTTAPWSVCEIWRAQGRQARIPAGWGPPPSNPEPTPVTDDDVEQISLVFGAGAQRGCYSPMRAPRGHTCMRCLEDPTAKMLRVASHVTFSPGIGLVGRVWLLGVAEVVDVPAVGASSTYARQEAALNAGVRTAIALPVVPPAKTPGGPRAPSAVIVIYFGERLVRAPAANGAWRRPSASRRWRGGGNLGRLHGIDTTSRPHRSLSRRRRGDARPDRALFVIGPRAPRDPERGYPAGALGARVGRATRGLEAAAPSSDGHDAAGLAAVVVFLRAVELLRQSAC